MRKFIVGFWMIFLGVAVASAGNSSNLNKPLEDKIDSIIKKTELIPIMINGDKDNRINIVLMNCWTSKDKEPYNSPAMRDEFIKDINESLIAALTPGNDKAQTAYANYRDYFNVYGLWFPDSPEWGKGMDMKMVEVIRDRIFLPWKDEYTGWATFLVLPNTTNGGGGAGRNLEARVGSALIAGNGIAKMLHEIAHTCLSIGDEYTGPATGTDAFPTYSVEKEYDRQKIKWREWIDPETPLPTPYTAEYKDKIGAFEGTQYHLTGYYRSTAQGCIMGAGVFDNTEKLCPICEQRLAMRVNTLVNPITSFSPSTNRIHISGKTKSHFAISHISPIPNTQVVRWILNGKTIATGVDKVDIEIGELSNYTLICSLTDESPLIHPDPPFAQFPKFEIQWEIINSKPGSNAPELAVQLKSKPQGKGSLGKFTVYPEISGGKPPYSFTWSNGKAEEQLQNVGTGIYDLVVTDSEFRKATAHTAILASSSEKAEKVAVATKTKTSNPEDFGLEVDVTASEKGKDNGKIAVRFSGKKKPYLVEWKDADQKFENLRIYEAEHATVNIPGFQTKDFYGASNNTFVSFNGNEGSISWSVEVAKSGIYPVDIVFGGISSEGPQMNLSINSDPQTTPVMFGRTLPLYTGWGKSTVNVLLKEGVNKLSLNSTGKSGPNVDYIQVPSSYLAIPIRGAERSNLLPGNYTVVVTDDQKNSVEKTIAVPEAEPFVLSDIEINTKNRRTLSIVNPSPGYTYLWYASNTPLYRSEKFEKALSSGTEFTPAAPGNYFVSAKNNRTQAESSNRIGCAVAKTPENKVNAINPTSLQDGSLSLWFDSSDLDGDGKTDTKFPERGPVLNWKDKSKQDHGKLFAKYEPNTLNGKGVCAFDNVWISDLSKKVNGFQTVILVYKESSMTFDGKCPFKDLNKYLGKSSDSGKRIFDRETIDEKTKNGHVYLNGKKVDPFNTPNPLDFCLLTVELGSKASEPFSRIEGLWEGSIAEMMFFDRALTETERKGIEEYLRTKWFSAVDLDF